MRSPVSRRFLTLASLALPLLLAVTGGPARAQGAGDIFTVSGVKVDATGESAAAARTVAMAQGQAEAANRLFRRLTLQEDWPKLPQIDASQAEAMTAGVGVSDEKSSTTRYLASLRVKFNPNPVRQYLRNAGVRYTDNQAAPVLLLPVLDSPGVRVLFDDPNPWRQAWDSLSLSNSLVPIVLPLGDLEDFAAVNAADALTGEWVELETVAARYGVDEVLVAHATERDGGGLDVTVTRVSPGLQDSRTRSFDGESLDAVTASAAKAIHDEMVREWKQHTAVSFGVEQSLSASVEFGSLAEWVSIRKRLAETSIIQEMDLIALSSTGAQVRLNFAGGVENLASSLGQRQIRLIEETGYWTLAMGGPQAPVPGEQMPGGMMPGEMAPDGMAAPESGPPGDAMGTAPVYEPGDPGMPAPPPETSDSAPL